MSPVVATCSALYLPLPYEALHAVRRRLAVLWGAFCVLSVVLRLTVCVFGCFQSLQLPFFLRLRRHSRWAKAGLREPPAIRLRSFEALRTVGPLGDVMCRSPARCTLKAVTARVGPGGNSLAEGEDLNMPALRRTTLCPLRTSCSGSRQELDWMRSFSFWSGSAHNHLHHLPPLESDA